MSTHVDKLVSEIRQASAKEPIDWDAIRGAVMTLDAAAQTKEQKAAVQSLKTAAEKRKVEMAVSGVERAFLQGKPNVDGWPRRF